MKSDKAMSNEVSVDTYCRHGFHEWLKSEAKDLPKNAIAELKCMHCGKVKSEAVRSILTVS